MKKINNLDLWFYGLLMFGILIYLLYRTFFLDDMTAMNLALGIMLGAVLMTGILNWFQRSSDTIIREQHELIIEMMAFLKALEMVGNKVKHDAKQQTKRKAGRKTVRKTAKSDTSKPKA